MLHRNNKLVWTGVNRHNLDTERNDPLCCGCQQKNWFPQMFRLCKSGMKFTFDYK